MWGAAAQGDDSTTILLGGERRERRHHGPGAHRQKYLARVRRKRASQEAHERGDASPLPDTIGGVRPLTRADLQGTAAMEREATLTGPRAKERAEEVKLHGLESAESIRDRAITLFARGRYAASGPRGSTFIGVPFLEDMRDLDGRGGQGGQDVAFVGVPLDTGTTYRSGTRFGPLAVRGASVLGGSYNPGRGVELHESLRMVDVGDVQVIPANIEKSFDQIALAVAYIHERGVFPVVIGGDHSIGYPDIRGLAPYVDGNIGIIHFDRHSDLTERTLDERMHASPFFHATNIPNAPATNLVQIGIGGWTGSKPGMRVARERGATVITVDDIDRFGIERIMAFALEVAWKDARAVWLSFDIDVMDPAFAPGTGTPEPGGLLPREVFRMLRETAREGLTGMELVEVSPPYDVSDLTASLGGRVIMEVLATLIENRRLGTPPAPADPDSPGAEEPVPVPEGG